MSVSIFSCSNSSRLIVVSIFFVTFLFVGMRIYQDYGISTDEPTSRANGMITLKYLGERFAPALIATDKAFEEFKTPLAEWTDRDYGVAFEAPVSLLERLLKLDDTRDIFFFRHMVTFLVCVCGVFAVFKLGERRFADWRIGILGALFMVLSPRLFAESFYNDKDAIFMALFSVAMNTLVLFLLRPTITKAIVHALATALAIDVRIMAIILPVATVEIFIIRLVKKDVLWRTALQSLAAYLAILIVSVVAFWPYLWPAPWLNFTKALENMAKFSMDRWSGYVLYLGAIQPGNDLPWHYIPVWISLTTPLLYVFLFGAGAISILVLTLRRGLTLWRTDDEWQDQLFLGLVVCPILSVIVLNSVLYFGWRQMYFVYPAFLLVALRGLIALWNCSFRSHLPSRAWHALLVVTTLSTLIYTMTWMIRWHPFQNVYFNVLVGGDVKTKFDVDYWGLSNEDALQYVLDHDKRSVIKLWEGSATRVGRSVLMLKSFDRGRIKVVKDRTRADYILTNYRLNATNYATLSDYVLYHQIRVDGEIINSLFKREARSNN
jgi:hypothetical protein